MQHRFFYLIAIHYVISLLHFNRIGFILGCAVVDGWCLIMWFEHKGRNFAT